MTRASPNSVAIQSAPQTLLESRIEAALAQEQRPIAVVFDLDNTLVDTRFRTLRAAHLYAAAHLDPEHPMARLTLEETPYDGAELAQLVGLDPALHGEFFRYWEDFFWLGESFELDQGLPAAMQWAWAAEEAGFNVLYLTGRIESLRSASEAQLRRLGLPFAGSKSLLCKPAMGLRTPTYKATALLRLSETSHIAWFLTESYSDIAAVQAQPATAHISVLIEFPVGPKGEPAIAADTPTVL
ncbi:MAG: hypothetical protein CO108_07775 [Deltaproteobacteria bacterium CG_4_9_14_3_um_filter_63_12]|nr:MAG: hypothetical protein CO108_07775 [Deltaproteobacteria bacterium CG_4_9_14_3_um_filter_63_12]